MTHPAAWQDSLLALMSEILEQPGIGAQDNFFSLGGDSLTAVDFVARAEEELGVDVPLGSLFENGNIAEMLAACTPTADDGLLKQ